MRNIKVSGLLSQDQQESLVALVKQYADCLAWDYTEMPGLSTDLVGHRLPIKAGYKPFKQAPRRFYPDLLPKIRGKISKLFEAGFIRPCRYAEWLSNRVPSIKKNDKVRICIDSRNLNLATPKGEYVMPIADMLTDSAAGHKYCP